jgi:hypothetical protein
MPLYSREGRVGVDGSRIVTQSATLNYIFGIVNRIVDWSNRTRISKENPALTQLLGVIHDTRLSASWYNNPMGLLAISANRKPTREEDRVYSIMQVIGPRF